MERVYQSWENFPKEQWKWKNFSPAEIACKGTKNILVNVEAMSALQLLRNRLRKPLIITSGYRSPKHNKAVGGATSSKHMQGTAFDISMQNHDPVQFVAMAKRCGFKGIGLYPRNNFIHIDLGPERQWGTPFPKRVVPEFAPEPVHVPEKLSEDEKSKAGIGVGAGITVATVVEQVPAVSSLLGNMAPVVQGIAVVAAILLVVYIIIKRSK